MLLKDPIATTENCRYCLMCRHIAPVGHVMHDEAVTPHGIALIVASQRRGLIAWQEDTLDIVYAEPDAGNCRAHCVTDQPLPAAIAAVRAELVAQKRAPAVVYDVHERLQTGHSAFGQDAPAPTSEKGDVALYVGDEAHYLWPSTVDSAMKLLEATGLNPVKIGIGRSNGYLACSLGFPDTAREQATSILDTLQACGARQLLVLSPGDAFTFRQLYEERLGITWPPEVELVDLATFLADRVASGDLAFKPPTEQVPYAYVDPTHAVRVPERFEPVRALVSAVLPEPPLELFWRRERAHPVGSTALQFTRPDIADTLTRARLEDARNAGAETLLCEDPGTLFQLNRFAKPMGLRVRGLYELLAERLI